MRFRQFSEGAMEDTIRIIEKTFSPERKAVSNKILELVRAVQMGKGDKMELARAITELTKSELEVKRSDPDLEVSTTQNIGMLKRAMDTVTGMSEGITEEELEEYKSIASLRNRSSLDAMARLKDRNKKKEPEVIEIPKGTQLDLFKKASEDIEEGAREIDPKKMQAYMDFKKEKDIDGSSVRMAVDNPDHPETKRMMTNDDFAKAVDMYKSAVKESVEESLTEALKVGDKVKVKKGSMKSPSQRHYETTVGTIVKDYGDDDFKVNFGGNDDLSIEGKLLVKTQVEESLTEEQFDEKAGEKDACYRKVKSRYKVWPSAYASGALVKCRKVGAANWGNSKKK